jgi:hypothetical protein
MANPTSSPLFSIDLALQDTFLTKRSFKRYQKTFQAIISPSQKCLNFGNFCPMDEKE